MRSRASRLGRSALAGLTATLMTVLVGCSEESVPRSSNRGSGSATDDTSVENAFIVPSYEPGNCAMQVDAGGAMRFTVTNNSPTENERLLGLSTDAAAPARVTADAAIPPESTVSFGEPNAELNAGDANRPPVELDRLAPDLVPATSTDVTFHFERAGDVTLPVPVEACPLQKQ